MRYVFVSYNYSPGFSTPESWLKRTEMYNGALEHLARQNEVINIKQINYEGKFRIHEVDHHFVRFYNKKTFFPLKLNTYIKSLSPDIVVVQGLHHPIQVILLRLVLPKKTKLVLQHHAEKPFSGWKKLVQKAADYFVNAYLFASHQIGMDWVEQGIISSPQKILEVMEVSSDFKPMERQTARLKTCTHGDPVFLWVGRLNVNKDPLTAVKAFLEYTEINPEARLYMIFHTDELRGEIEDLLRAKKACDKVTLIGKAGHNELSYWFNSADFFLSASHYEGSGTALCEAMSCGCVPVVTDIPSFRTMTDNGAIGLLYPPGDQEALLAAFLKTKSLNLPEEQTKALNYFSAKLSFAAIARQIKSVVESLEPKVEKLVIRLRA